MDWTPWFYRALLVHLSLPCLFRTLCHFFRPRIESYIFWTQINLQSLQLCEHQQSVECLQESEKRNKKKPDRLHVFLGCDCPHYSWYWWGYGAVCASFSIVLLCRAGWLFLWLVQVFSARLWRCSWSQAEINIIRVGIFSLAVALMMFGFSKATWLVYLGKRLRAFGTECMICLFSKT